MYKSVNKFWLIKIRTIHNLSLWIFLDNIIVRAPSILHFKGLGMRNLKYEMRICQKCMIQSQRKFILCSNFYESESLINFSRECIPVVEFWAAKHNRLLPIRVLWNGIVASLQNLGPFLQNQLFHTKNIYIGFLFRTHYWLKCLEYHFLRACNHSILKDSKVLN